MSPQLYPRQRIAPPATIRITSRARTAIRASIIADLVQHLTLLFTCRARGASGIGMRASAVKYEAVTGNKRC